MRISDLLFSEFDGEVTKARAMLERVPGDKAGFSPHPKSMPLSRLASYLAEFTAFGLTVLTKRGLDFFENQMLMAAVLKRRTFAIALCFATTFGAAGCGSTSAVVTSPTGVERPAVVAPPPSSSAQASCSAATAEWALGRRATDDLLERARVAANASVARFVIRGQPLTTEYLGTRLNLETDEQQSVVAVRCG